MKVSFTTPKFIRTAKTYIQEKASNSAKYVRELSHDTAEFVKKNPKHTAAAVGVGAAAVLIGGAIKHAVENARQKRFQKEMLETIITAQNDAQKEQMSTLIDRQARVIKTMKTRIQSDRECIAANHEAIEAARDEIAKLKAANTAEA